MEIFILVGTALLFSFLLLGLMAVAGRKRDKGSKKQFQPEPLWSQEQFENVCIALLEELKLEIKEVQKAGATTDVLAQNPAPLLGGEILVRLDYRDPTSLLGVPEIIEFSNLILQERISKGFFITTGRFTADLPTIGELAPIEFIDGEKLKRLIEKYHLPVLP